MGKTKKAVAVILVIMYIACMGVAAAEEAKPYWIEPEVNNVYTTTDIPAGETVTLYAKQEAGYSPDGENTFEFFDDFEGTSLDTTKWTTRQGTIGVADGKLEVIGAGSTRGLIDSQDTFTSPLIYTARARTNKSTFTEVHVLTLRKENDWSSRSGDLYSQGYTTQNSGSSTRTESLPLSDPTVYNTYSIFLDSSTSTLYQNGNEIVEHTTDVPNIENVITFYESVYLWSGFVDYAYIRQYADVTSTVTDMGGYYKIEITNNEATDLTGYQVQLDAATLGITSDTESWHFTDLLVENNTAPNVTNLKPTGELTDNQITLSCDVNDTEMGNGVDSVNTSFYLDGEYQGSDILTANGTASLDVSVSTGGVHSWYVNATDDWGGYNQSGNVSITVPSSFYIRNATNITQLVDTADVTVRFYEQGENTQVYEKTTSTGTVDLAGLPVGSDFVAVVNADGYEFRNVVIENIYEQNSIYLIPENETWNEVEFTMEDYTGKFPAAETVLYIQRPINMSKFGGDGIQWQTMAGDYIGADGVFSDKLLNEERYKIVVKNTDGETRVAGQYNSLSSDTVNLVIGELEWDVVPEGSYLTSAYFEDTTDDGEADNGIIRYQYSDPKNLTTALSLQIYEEGNATNVIYEDSVEGTLGEYSTYTGLTGQALDSHYVVEWTATRDGETIQGVIPVRTNAAYIDNPLEGEMGQLLFSGLLLFIVVAFGGIYSSSGAVISAGFVGMMWVLGIRFVPLPVIILAGIVAVLFHISDSGEGSV